VTDLSLKQERGDADALSAADADFLRALGKRVREWREQRGLARKALAREADISERYLGQLEAGEGNVSIMLLRRIASALNVSLREMVDPDGGDSVEQRLIRRFLEGLPGHRLEDVIFRLMREFGHEEATRRRRIALIGLRGAGKSTLGALLAKELQVPFIETDREVERATGLPLTEIFGLYGQSGYRRIERRCLEEVITDNTKAVLAVGGGIVADDESYKLLLANCFTVWLRASPEEHMARVRAQGDLRPMAGHAEAMEELKRILASRESAYGQADAVVDTSGQGAGASLARLRQVVQG
jgi:XRE family aerobic/anaerobic benzoate catabolism transcriptional regulator